MKILIVDNSEADRKLIEFSLRRHPGSFEITEAHCGQDALDILAERCDFDCILLDYKMHDMDGITVLKKLYNTKTQLTPCPVVMLTGYGSESVMIDALHYGAQDYLIKDTISKDTLAIVLRKSREFFDLKVSSQKAEQQLLHAQKMDAVGQLTGGIAHDFNNLLTIIFGNARLMDLLFEKDEPDIEMLKAKLDGIKRASTRGADLVKRLMVFSRQRNLDPEVSNLNTLIEELQELLLRSTGSSIELNFEQGNDLWLIDIDPAQLEHAIINMAMNARDAMPDGGTLSIQTENIFVDDEYFFKPADLKSGAYVMLSISDTGYGMSEDVRSKIFDPFFTTKDVGKGTGLGLSMAYGFVRDSGGDVHVYSEAGKGTCFRIYLPKSLSDTPMQAGEVELVDIAAGDETILVVEDEEEIRNLAVGLLKSYGYSVLEAENSAEAIDILTQNQDIDLLFTDIAMPGEMNGVQLAARALTLYQNLKVLFTTGYTKETVPDYDLIKEGYPLISKPYQYGDLLQTIRDVLDGAPSS